MSPWNSKLVFFFSADATLRQLPFGQIQVKWIKNNNDIFKTEWNKFGDRQTIIILFILLFYWRTNKNNIDKKFKKTTTTKKLRATKKKIRDEFDGGICFGLFGFLCRMSRRSHLNPFFWNVFTLFTNGYDHFLHCERILIMSKSLLELLFMFLWFVINFHKLFSLFTVF